MLIIAEAHHNAELVRAIQRFRGAIYAADGAIHELPDGRHIEAADERSWHIAAFVNAEIAGAIRYERKGAGRVRVGGWCVAAEHRGGRIGIKLALECVHLAERLGDT